TITWKLYDNGECKGTPLAEDEAKVTGNGTFETPKGTTISSVGTYYWEASSADDRTHSAVDSRRPAEPVNVTPAVQTITTPPPPLSGLDGDAFNHNPDAFPTRRSSDLTITWKLYDNGECKGTPLAEDEAKVTGNGTFETPKGTTISSVGTYYWVASYSGDHNNTAVATKCADEPVNVTAAHPSIPTTQATASCLLRAAFKANADISVLFEPAGGTSTYKHSYPTRRSSDLLAEDEAKVTGNGTFETPKGTTISSVGTYYWVASYSGDHNNASMRSGCADEPVS